MKIRHALLCWLVLMPAWMSAQETKTPAKTEQFLLICLGYCQGPECSRDAMARIAALRPAEKKCGVRLGVSAVNEFSCPGWSFYTHGMNPRGDATPMAALKTSDAPYWGAVEWLPMGAGSQQDWERAFRNTFSIERCRYLCVFHWQIIKDWQDATKAVTACLSGRGAS